MGKAWTNSFRIIRSHPSVVLPFLCLAVLETLWLSMCYYAPRPPVSLVLAPPIKAFMGEQFLHYPLNFLTLPRLIFIGRVLIYLSFGLISFGMTICAVYQIKIEKESIRFWGNLNRSLRRYPAVLFMGMIYSIIAFVAHRIPRFIVGKLVTDANLLTAASYAAFAISFILMILIEATLIFAPAFLLIYRQKLFSSIKNSFVFFKQHLIATLSFIFIFRVFNAALTLVKWNIPDIVKKIFPLFPEVTLIILGVDILIFFIANASIALVATQLMLANKET